MVNPDFLRVAREALGLTQTQLAQDTGLPQTDISRWESGLRVPNDQQVERLAQRLDVPMTLLTSDIRLYKPVHRTARIHSKRAERQVDARLEISRIAASRLVRDLDIDSPFAFPTPGDAAPADPETAAETIRRVWRMPDGPVDHLAAYLEAAGAFVLRVDFGNDDILAAYTHPRGEHRWFFINTRSGDGARARFSLAHELGHAILHWDRFEPVDHQIAEKEAHSFAAALLMPQRAMLATFGGRRITLAELQAVRTRWGVSMGALITRASELDLITPTHKTRLWKQISARGWRKSEPGWVPLEEPSLFPEALDIHRHQHNYTDRDLAQIAGLGLHRLADVMGDYFTVPGGDRPKLRAVPHIVT